MPHEPARFRRRLPGLLLLAVVLGSALALGLSSPETAPDTPLFTFGVIADAQYCDCEARGSRYYRHSLDKLAAAVDTLNAREVAFTVHLGDFIDRAFASFAQVLPLYQRLQAPAYHALGNHDFSVDSTYLDTIPDLLGLPARYYQFAHRGWRFVVLDGNDLSLYATRAGTARRAQADRLYRQLDASGAPHAQTWNGGLSAPQLEWLRGTLDAAAEAGERVVLFAHFPVYPKDPHNLWNDEAVVRLLETYDHVVAYLNGHNHAGAYAVHAGTHYVTVPGMVETPEETAFAVVEVYADRLEIDGYGRVQDRTLAIPPAGSEGLGR